VAGRTEGLGPVGLVDPLDLIATETLGNSTATASASGSVLAADPLDLQAGEGLQLATAVAGTTTDPGDFSQALAAKFGGVLIDNGGPDGLRLAFQLSYNSSVHAETTDPTVPAYGWVLGLVSTDQDSPNPRKSPTRTTRASIHFLSRST
jgi:hypothetical protein